MSWSYMEVAGSELTTINRLPKQLQEGVINELKPV